jgi:hypothetical protein
MKRRSLLKILGAFPAVSTMACGGRDDALQFFDTTERATFERLAELVMPGATALGAVTYADRLLSGAGIIFASGPYSGRTPFPSVDGRASAEFPPNDFEEREPLDRIQRAAWHELLFAEDGMRATMRKGLAALNETTTLDDLAPAFLDLVVQLTCEGCFAAPEYGGNINGAGWRMVHYEGDVMPLGYAAFDDVAGIYRESATSPVSTPNPGPDPDPLDDEVRALLDDAVALLGGRRT